MKYGIPTADETKYRMTQQDWQIAMLAISTMIRKWEQDGGISQFDIGSAKKTLRWIADKKINKGDNEK